MRVYRDYMYIVIYSYIAQVVTVCRNNAYALYSSAVTEHHNTEELPSLEFTGACSCYMQTFVYNLAVLISVAQPLKARVLDSQYVFSQLQSHGGLR
jgi:hypothetical protein